LTSTDDTLVAPFAFAVIFEIGTLNTALAASCVTSIVFVTFVPLFSAVIVIFPFLGFVLVFSLAKT